MTLRARLIASFTGLLLLAIVAVGLLGARSIEAILTDQVDARLDEISGRFGGGPPEISDFRPRLTRGDAAVILLNPEGQTVAALPSGFQDSPDPLPDIDALDRDSAERQYLPAIDQAFRYRAITRDFGEFTLVLAVPLREATDATRALVRSLVLAGGVVLLIGAAGTWWAVRAGLRPVDRMVETAEAIAAGDLSRRIPDTDADTELGRLGGSLNDMLGHIEGAVTTERDAQDRLRRFVADASHELRTPLAALSGYAELFEKGGLDDPADLERAMSRIRSESGRMARLVEDMLLLARLDQTQHIETRRFDLATAIHGVVHDHRAIDVTRPVTFSGQSPVMVDADEARMTQVVTNLLANARAHTPEGTDIAIELTEESDQIRLTVSDSGPGIPEAALASVFERFYRSDAGRTRAKGGSGLGLAIVSAIVTAHGGTVRARNHQAGGTIVEMVLPKVQQPI